MWWVILLGCAEPTAPVPGIQIGELGDDVPCRAVPVEVDDLTVSPDGWKVAPGRLLDQLVGRFDGTFTFRDGTAATLVSEHVATGAVRLVTQEPLYPKAAAMCDTEWVEVDVEWRLEAAALSVYSSTVARMDPLGPVTLFVRLPGSVGLPYVAQDLDTEDVYLALGARPDEDGAWSGTATWEGIDQGFPIDAEAFGTFVMAR